MLDCKLVGLVEFPKRVQSLSKVTNLMKMEEASAELALPTIQSKANVAPG